LPLLEHVIQAQGKRVLFTDVAARLVDNCQAVGVWVLAKADVGAKVRDVMSYIGKILGGRFRWMDELPVRYISDDPRFTAKRFKQAGA
jgi:hypothetical protein